jgi:hypothetical protein
MLMREPIVTDPLGFDIDAAWQECSQFVREEGGLTRKDGSTNWKAAFGADPGVCSCPCCGAMYWAWGNRQRCRDCDFEYPTDWWPMYSWGCQAAKSPHRYDHERRMKHPYYRYGFENHVANAWENRLRVDWRSVVGQRGDGS